MKNVYYPGGKNMHELLKLEGHDGAWKEIRLKNRRVLSKKLDDERTMFVFKILNTEGSSPKIMVTSITLSNEATEALWDLYNL